MFEENVHFVGTAKHEKATTLSIEVASSYLIIY
jgi:hypothetical protein